MDADAVMAKTALGVYSGTLWVNTPPILAKGNKIEKYHIFKTTKEELIEILKAVLQEYKVDAENIKLLIKKYSLNISPKKLEQIITKYHLEEKKTL